MEKLFKVEEVAILIDSSVNSINLWYKWKRAHPEHQMAKLLPDFVKSGVKHTRYWKETDIALLKQFKESMPKGRNGLMSDITQRYVQKRRVKENEQG